MKGIVYMILNWVDTETFVGGTTKSLQERMQIHKNMCEQSPKKKLHQHMNKVGIDNFTIIEIETLSVPSILGLMEREKYWIQKYNPSLNLDTTKREKVLASKKAYYERNKVDILAKVKQNPTSLALRKKRYYELHRKQINAKRAATKVDCDCGGYYRFNNKTIHEKSAKHQTWLKVTKTE